jgi:ribosomal protein S18 acetylase RimI-like enzyme
MGGRSAGSPAACSTTAAATSPRAVATSERGRGLGRALLLHAPTDLQQAGAPELTLDVVAQNETALALYRSVDLEIEREWRFYPTFRRGQNGELARGPTSEI